ncbi:hypothetical protein [Clostridium paridis]|uniref:Uncharacterized protein n=1 Tax=Clostridium paridis TaxID=2803863 RepID=A0A937K638_9CLOT|nr:hypothetical protein [Clostridium paridis]MBL4933283.1 hypothetical protein [Clostridium paridis]
MVTFLAKVIIFCAVVRLIVSFFGKGNGQYKRRSNSRNLFTDEMNRQQFQEFQEEMNRQQFQNFERESLKQITPFEHGGYDMTQGNSFNDNNHNGMNGL